MPRKRMLRNHSLIKSADLGFDLVRTRSSLESVYVESVSVPIEQISIPIEQISIPRPRSDAFRLGIFFDSRTY